MYFILHRHMAAIQQAETSQTIEEGFCRCEYFFGRLSASEPARSDDAQDWDAAASVNFFEFVLKELRKLSENGSELARLKFVY